MSLLRLVASIPAVLFACALGSAGLGGCYDLSSSGPRPEDFANTPASEAKVDEQASSPASPTALDRSDVLLQALGSDPTPPSAEASGALLPAQNVSDTPR